MIRKPLSELRPNPKNRRNIDEKNYLRLVQQMQMGDHSIFLITDDGMVVDGNHRLKAAIDSGWQEVDCKVLSFQQDENGFFAVIDGVVIKNAETIPYHYKTIEDGITAYALSRNSSAGYYNDDIFTAYKELDIDWNMFPLENKPAEDIEEIIKGMAKTERKKKLMLIINCDDEVQFNERYFKITELGIPVKKKE